MIKKTLHNKLKIIKIASKFDSVYHVSYFWQVGYFNSVSVNNKANQYNITEYCIE